MMASMPPFETETYRLERLLQAKLEGISRTVVQDLDLDDLMYRTPRCILSNVPSDINLEWFLKYRNEVNACLRHGDSPLLMGVKRAIWYYSIDPLFSWDPSHLYTRARSILLLVQYAGGNINAIDRMFLDAVTESLYCAKSGVPAFEKREAFLKYYDGDPSGREPILLDTKQMAEVTAIFQGAADQLGHNWDQIKFELDHADQGVTPSKLKSGSSKKLTRKESSALEEEMMQCTQRLSLQRRFAPCIIRAWAMLFTKQLILGFSADWPLPSDLPRIDPQTTPCQLDPYNPLLQALKTPLTVKPPQLSALYTPPPTPPQVKGSANKAIRELAIYNVSNLIDAFHKYLEEYFAGAPLPEEKSKAQGKMPVRYHQSPDLMPVRMVEPPGHQSVVPAIGMGYSTMQPWNGQKGPPHESAFAGPSTTGPSYGGMDTVDSGLQYPSDAAQNWAGEADYAAPSQDAAAFQATAPFQDTAYLQNTAGLDDMIPSAEPFDPALFDVLPSWPEFDINAVPLPPATSYPDPSGAENAADGMPPADDCA